MDNVIKISKIEKNKKFQNLFRTIEKFENSKSYEIYKKNLKNDLNFKLKLELKDTKIFGIKIYFIGPKFYKRIKTIEIPYMERRENKTIGHILNLKIIPIHPIPCTFDIIAKFSSEEHILCKAKLDDLKIELNDLLLPLKLPKELEVIVI